MKHHHCIRTILAASACALVLSSCMKTGDSGGLAVGRPAPPLKAAGWINGKAPTESELAGKVVVVDAWASW